MGRERIRPDANVSEPLRAGMAVLNGAAAETTLGRDGRVAHALPHDAVLELLEAHRRLDVR